MPTQEEINRAKDYLLLRLKAERIAVSTLNTALLSAARRIVEISRKYNIPPENFRFSVNASLQLEVSNVLTILKEALFNEIKGLDTFKESDDNSFIAPILTAKDHGKTFKERLNQYVSRWGFELEATIAAAGLAGIRDTKAIEQGIRDYLDRPYDNPWIKEHIGEGDAVRLEGMPHYGRGVRIAAASALAVLLTTVVAKGWMENWHHLNSTKVGYYVYRGSSFPCEICDAQVGFLHDINDEMGLPPFHNYCKCYTVYVDTIGNTSK